MSIETEKCTKHAMKRVNKLDMHTGAVFSSDDADCDDIKEHMIGFADEDDELDEDVDNSSSEDAYAMDMQNGGFARLSSLKNTQDGLDFSDISSTNDMSKFEEKDDDDCLKDKPENEIDVTKFNQPKFVTDANGKKKLNKPKNMYCDNSELIEEIRKYQEDGVATEKLGELIIKIALHMTTMVRFWRYSHSIKEELAQHAILQMMLSVPKFNLKNEKANAFGYLSMISYRDMLHSLKRHFKQNKIRDVLAEAYLGRISENPNDERIGMLKQTLAKSEEYSAFLKNDRYPFQQKKEVDMFALSRDEQRRHYKENLRREAEENEDDDGPTLPRKRGRPRKNPSK